ncbi:MAG TPA: chemotaxis protein CheW [Deltaproteobacteria bacterium]|nr:chemotaxis protein CheW [Deltaproteobacteria bacterium]
MGEFDDLIEEFVAESKEHISDIEDDLIKIESDMEHVDPEVINRVFRAAHSIKGSSKFLDLVNIGDLAHRMEDVLNLIRSGKLIPSSDVAGPLLLAADMLKTMLDDVTASNSMDISEPLGELQKILDREGAGPKKAAKAEPTGAPDPLAVFGIAPDRIKSKLGSSQVYVLTIDAASGDVEHIKSELKNLGEVLSQKTTPEGKLVTLFATIMEADMVPLALGVDKGSFIQVTEAMLAPRARQPQPPRPAQAAPKPKEADQAPKPAPRPKPPRAEEEGEEGGYRKVSYDEPDAKQMIESLKEEVKAARKEDNTSFITFTLDNEVYAVPIQTIEEIIGLQEISLLPNVPDFIRGVINLRGEIVPIMDLRLKFGLTAKEYTQFTVFLIVRVEDRLMGMVVDNVADVLVIDPGKVQKKPAFSAKISTEFIKGVYKDAQEDLVILVDVPALIKPEEWELGYI